MMKELALLGCIVFSLFLCFAFVFIFTLISYTINNGEKDERDERTRAYCILIIILIMIISFFIIYPESFGYEKISAVSENYIESDG